jgi:hypothetical protein
LLHMPQPPHAVAVVLVEFILDHGELAVGLANVSRRDFAIGFRLAEVWCPRRL